MNSENITAALIQRLHVKSGHEKGVQELLDKISEKVNGGNVARTWIAVKLAPRSFEVVATFKNEKQRETYLNSEIGKSFTKSELFEKQPENEQGEIVAAHEMHEA